MSEIPSPANPQGPWGSYPAGPNLSPIGNLYGWSHVAGTDGSEMAGSGNLTTVRNSAGQYTVKPANTGIPSGKNFAVVIDTSAAPFVSSILLGVGPQGNWVVVAKYLSTTGTATDSDFLILYFTAGNTPF